MMRQSREPEDALLIPLLLELSLVIDEGKPSDVYADYATSVEVLGDKLPKWEDFVELEEGAASSARAADILQRGRQFKAEREADAASQAASLTNAATTNSGNRPIGNNRPIMDNQPTTDSGQASPVQIVRPSSEVNVLTWWELGQRTPFALGKVMPKVRNPIPNDAPLYANFGRNISEKPMESQTMIMTPAMGAEEFSRWILTTYGYVRRRFQNYPQGKVVEVGFKLLENQVAPVGLQQYHNGKIIGGVLALQSVLTGVERCR